MIERTPKGEALVLLSVNDFDVTTVTQVDRAERWSQWSLFFTPACSHECA